MNTFIEPTKTKIYNDDIYLIDAALNCKVISSRHGANGLLPEDSFFDLIDTRTRTILLEYLSSFGVSTLKIPTRIGEATVYNGIFPSTMLFVAQFKRNNEAEDISCLDSNRLLTESIDKEALCAQALDISELCGCPIRINANDFDDDFTEDSLLSEFDFPLFTAFLINALLLARRTSKNREAEVILETKEESPYVSVIFEPTGDLSDVYGELSSISSLSEQLRVVFTRSVSNGKLKVTISPTRRNWALLGIKTPFEFSWEK